MRSSPHAGSGGTEPQAAIVVGVLSDTHGSLYPHVIEALGTVDHILHAGDIGSPEVLSRLRAIAPVTAVQGNCDTEAWARSLPRHARVELGGVVIALGHITSQPRAGGAFSAAVSTPGSDDRAGAGAPRVDVTGHSHLPALDERDGVLHLNPGSAGPRRFGRPRTIARLVIHPAPDASSGSHKPGTAPLPRVDAEIITVAGE